MKQLIPWYTNFYGTQMMYGEVLSYMDQSLLPSLFTAQGKELGPGHPLVVKLLMELAIGVLDGCATTSGSSMRHYDALLSMLRLVSKHVSKMEAVREAASVLAVGEAASVVAGKEAASVVAGKEAASIVASREAASVVAGSIMISPSSIMAHSGVIRDSALPPNSSLDDDVTSPSNKDTAPLAPSRRMRGKTDAHYGYHQAAVICSGDLGSSAEVSHLLSKGGMMAKQQKVVHGKPTLTSTELSRALDAEASLLHVYAVQERLKHAVRSAMESGYEGNGGSGSNRTLVDTKGNIYSLSDESSMGDNGGGAGLAGLASMMQALALGFATADPETQEIHDGLAAKSWDDLAPA
jgi:hypothetical protein